MNIAQTPNSLFLSLGSNMGNRLENLQNAVDLLFENLGLVLKVSSVYETPAMGFHGSPFLNAAVVLKTEMKPLDVLTIIMDIEKSLGRERSNSPEYASRPIDIDVLFFGDEIITSEKLIVPHPRMQMRKFVLQPLMDLDPEYVHPLVRKPVSQLLAETTDLSEITVIKEKLEDPRRKYPISQFGFIAIEGNIGAGKTSLATKIAEEFNAKLILERFKENPFLPKFYKNAAQYAFPLEMSFLADRYQQMMDDSSSIDLFTDCIISDYDIFKSLVFARITLAEEEFLLYKKLFDIMQRELPKPHVYVYIYQDTDRLLKNIQKRGREYEQEIEADYLDKLNSGYLELIKSKKDLNVKIIDISDMDFIENRKDYIEILQKIVAAE